MIDIDEILILKITILKLFREKLKLNKNTNCFI